MDLKISVITIATLTAKNFQKATRLSSAQLFAHFAAEPGKLPLQRQQ
jgi:hypothetical protein